MNNSFSPTIFYLSPLLILVFTAVFVLLLDLFLPEKNRKWLLGFTMTGLMISTFVSVELWESGSISLLSEAIRVDRFSLFFTHLAIFLTFLTTLHASSMLKDKRIPSGEFFFFILSCCVGMSLMAWSTDLMTLFISLEIMSLTVYILTGIQKERSEATEGAFKYFLLGAFSTGFLLYGIAFIYASAESTHFSDIANFLIRSRYTIPTIFYIGVALLMIGFGFKIAAVPFHMWVPDAYQGAHPTITALMATGIKAAAFSSLIRFFLVTLFAIKSEWDVVIGVLAIATMTIGNIAALMQKNIKRMLAYSSIAHAGYILVAVSAAKTEVFDLSLYAILFYLIAYALMTMGAFSVVILASQDKEKDSIDDYAGYGFSHPYVGIAMALFMLSLTGVPLTAGFIGKFYIFSAALKSKLFFLALIAVLNSVVASYYYLRVIVVFYMKPGTFSVLPVSYPVAIVLMVTSVGTLLLGIFPSVCFDFLKDSISSLL